MSSVHVLTLVDVYLFPVLRLLCYFRYKDLESIIEKGATTEEEFAPLAQSVKEGRIAGHVNQSRGALGGAKKAVVLDKSDESKKKH